MCRAYSLFAEVTGRDGEGSQDSREEEVLILSRKRECASPEANHEITGPHPTASPHSTTDRLHSLI